MWNRFESKSPNGIKSCFGNFCESNWISSACVCVCMCMCVLKANIFSQTLERNETSLENDLFVAWVLARFNFMMEIIKSCLGGKTNPVIPK